MNKIPLLLFAVLLGGCFHDTGDNQTADVAPPAAVAHGEIVATVNGVKIPAVRISAYALSGGQNGDRQSIVNNMIVSELITQQARTAGLHNQPNIAEQLIVAEQTVLGRAYTQKFITELPVSDEAVQSKYDELKADFAGRHEYRSAHILVEDEALAKDLHAQIAADNGKMADLAAQHSQDPGSSAQGGDLGWLEASVLVPEFSEALIAAEPGSLVPQPVKTRFGFHIIMVKERRPVAVPAMSDEFRERIKQAIRADSFASHLAELRERAQISQ